MKDIPEDLNAITKMVNDTIRQRKKSPATQDIPELFIGFVPGQGIKIYSPICNMCQKPSGKINETCQCQCHPIEEKQF